MVKRLKLNFVIAKAIPMNQLVYVPISLSDKPVKPTTIRCGSHGEGLRIYGVALAMGIVHKGLSVAVNQQDSSFDFT